VDEELLEDEEWLLLEELDDELHYTQTHKHY
jgi:hypothetical protein